MEVQQRSDSLASKSSRYFLSFDKRARGLVSVTVCEKKTVSDKQKKKRKKKGFWLVYLLWVKVTLRKMPDSHSTGVSHSFEGELRKLDVPQA